MILTLYSQCTHIYSSKLHQLVPLPTAMEDTRTPDEVALAEFDNKVLQKRIKEAKEAKEAKDAKEAKRIKEAKSGSHGQETFSPRPEQVSQK